MTGVCHARAARYMIAIMSQEIFSTFRKLPGRSESYGAGSLLFRREETVRSLFLLESGSVALLRSREDGGLLLLHRARGPAIVAEASLHSPAYHCDGVCEENCDMFVVPMAKVRGALRSDPALAGQWQSWLARELQAARYRSELLTRKTVAARLDGWQELHGALPPRGNWKNLAAELGVTPEALYRELARRQTMR